MEYYSQTVVNKISFILCYITTATYIWILTLPKQKIEMLLKLRMELIVIVYCKRICKQYVLPNTILQCIPRVCLFCVKNMYDFIYFSKSYWDIYRTKRKCLHKIGREMAKVKG